MSEEKKFTIGQFSFENYYEYREALEDVKKIELINKELDVQDPEVAIRLYNDIRDGIIKFNTPLGQQFADHVGDIVANKSAGLLDDRAVIKEAEGQVKSQKALGFFLIAAAIVVFGIYAFVEIKDIYHTRQIANIQQSVSDGSNSESNPVSTTENGKPQSSDVAVKINWPQVDISRVDKLDRFKDIYAQNTDLVGWLSIADTDINYPVMQTVENPEYYLRKDFNQKDSTAGTLFADYRCNMINSNCNTIIYGHNMRDGSMFGSLKKYLAEEYLVAHPTISFSTLYEEREYEIVAVGLSEVGYDDDEEYKYYDFIDPVSDEDFDEFTSFIFSKSIYGNASDISKYDQLLTLSTCNSYTEDGRLFVVAKRIK